MKEGVELFILKEPHKIDRDIKLAKEKFWELAKSRVRIDSQEEHELFHNKYFPSNEKAASGAFVLQRGFAGDKNDPEKGVLGFEISINRDFFGEGYADLIPYAVEHEIYEAWLHAKRGWNPKSVSQGHLLARKAQIKMAMKDGRAERMIEFYNRKVPALKKEFEDAYFRIKEDQHSH